MYYQAITAGKTRELDTEESQNSMVQSNSIHWLVPKPREIEKI